MTRIKIAQLERRGEIPYLTDVTRDDLAALIRLARAAHALHVAGGPLNSHITRLPAVLEALAAFDFEAD